MSLPTLVQYPGDYVSSTLTSQFVHSSDTSIAIAGGDISAFGTPTPAKPIRVQLALPSQFNTDLQIWTISDRTATANYLVTGVSGFTLTGVTFESGTNQDFPENSLVTLSITARDFADIHAHIAGGPLNVLTAGAAIGVKVYGDGTHDDAPAINAIRTANPGRLLYLPQTIAQPIDSVGGFYLPSYYCASSIDFSAEPGGGIIGDGTSTMIQFAPKVSGIILGAGQVLKDISLHGMEAWIGSSGNYTAGVIPAGRYHGVNVTMGASDADGVRMMSGSSIIENVNIAYFGRDGINGSGNDLGFNSGIGPECCELRRISSALNRGNGVTIEGGDSNCTTLSTVSNNVNQFWAIKFNPFLAGTVISPQANQNFLDSSWNTGVEQVVSVASITRASNVVTMTFAAPYTSASISTGDGVWVQTCTDPSFVGRWRVTGTSGQSATWTQIAADATATPSGGSVGTATKTILPPDGAISSIARAGNIVTVNWSAPYTVQSGQIGFVPAQGITLSNCSDASFNGTFVVKSVASDNTSLTFWSSTPQSVVSAVRASNVVTLNIYGLYRTTPNNAPLQAGDSVIVSGSTDASFNGTFTIATVDESQGYTAITYNQTGANGSIGVSPALDFEVVTIRLNRADATTTGTARMAMPQDLWDACGLLGGSYYAPSTNGRNVWINPYAEGGTRSRFSHANVIINPVWSEQPEVTSDWTEVPLVISAAGDVPTVNKPVGLLSPYDLSLSSYQALGLTGNQTLFHTIQDIAGVSHFLLTSDVYHWLIQGRPTGAGSLIDLFRLDLTAGTTKLNSPTGSTSVYFNVDEGGTNGIKVGVGTGTGPFSSLLGGQLVMTPIADSAAQNGAVFLGSDHGGKFCRKDSGGTVHVMTETP